MPEEVASAAPPAEEQAPSAPEAAETQEGESERDGNEWLRETAQGLIYSRPLDTAARSQQLSDARAELNRGRRGKGTEEKPPEASDKPQTEEASASSEPPPSAREADDQEFQRRVQAEVDRREAVRRQRDQAQQERVLRQTNPTEYARLKEQQEAAQQQGNSVFTALQSISRQFDDATVKPLMDALPSDEVRNEMLKDSGHGIPGRKEIVTRAIERLKKLAYEEGFTKGKESAGKSLRKSSAFRKEILAELRGSDEEDEPDVALANGSVDGSSFDMNDWMRSVTGRRNR